MVTPTKDGFETSRRTVLARTGIVAVTVLGAGCTGDDSNAADSGGSTNPGEESTDTPTETTTEPEETATETTIEEPTGTEAAGLPSDMKKIAERETELLQWDHAADEFADVVADKRNRWTYRPVGETDAGGTEYERIVDVWVDDSVDPLGSYTREELLSREGIGDAYTGLIRGFGGETYNLFLAENQAPDEPRVLQHTYRVQQGPDYSAPFAAATTPPAIWPELKQRAKEEVTKEEYKNKSDAEIFRETIAEYLLEDTDRLTVQA